MELDWLFPDGTKLSEVPPEFRGMPQDEWRLKTTVAEIVRVRDLPETTAFWSRFFVRGEPRLAGQAISTPRDNYGMKGVR
jgi:hypothetical protein